jgi:hypothetical protein
MVVAVADDLRADPEYALLKNYLALIEDDNIRNYTILLALEQSVITKDAVEKAIQDGFFKLTLDLEEYNDILEDKSKSVAATLLQQEKSQEKKSILLNEINEAQEHVYKLFNLHRIGIAEAYAQDPNRKEDGWDAVLEYKDFKDDPDALIAAVGKTHPTSITDTPRAIALGILFL